MHSRQTLNVQNSALQARNEFWEYCPPRCFFGAQKYGINNEKQNRNLEDEESISRVSVARAIFPCSTGILISKRNCHKDKKNQKDICSGNINLKLNYSVILK